MLKKIDGKSFFQLGDFHLRYFRIVFQSNQMIIKNDKQDSKINKEIPLSEFINVELDCSKKKTRQRSGSADSGDMIFLECCQKKDLPYSSKKAYKETASHIIEHFKINERAREKCQWAHKITLETRDRNFQLYCPSGKEARIWLRVLLLIVRMNKTGKNVSQLNPYVFEQQEFQKLNKAEPTQ